MDTSAFDATLPLLYVDTTRDSIALADFLEEHGVSYRRIEVEQDPGRRAEAERKAGRPTLPVLDWRGDLLVGYDEKRLADFLRAHDIELEDS